ncbi:MAG TPA: DUF1549 and DUF1553 domain-containing protein, partial [Humisphaera sp.]
MPTDSTDRSDMAKAVHILIGWACVVLAAGGTSVAAAAEPASPAVDFRRDVAPILEQRCVRCHEAGNAKGDVTMTRAALADGGYVKPRDPAASELLDLVSAPPGKRPKMPKDGAPLTDAQVATLRQWVAQGADWPAGVELQNKARADKTWWSLQPVADAKPPSPDGLPAAWAANPVDRFVYAKLAEKNLTPSGPADPRALVRRLTYDLTGLPPTPEQVEAFAADPSPAAYAALVDRLLASKAYGERWGRHWLDVVRFGESNGFERNILIETAWPFRDYVIRSFNEDKPFERLVLEHLAGDVVAAEGSDGQVGTAFLVCGPYDNVGNSDPVAAAQIRADAVDEMIRAAGESFLGLTVGCARCHDHKFDPIAQADYYGLYATFAGVRHGDRPIVPAAERAAIDAKVKLLAEARAKAAAERDALRSKPTTAPAGAAAAAATDAKKRLAELDAQVRDLDRQIREAGQAKRVWAGNFSAAPGPFHTFKGGDPQKKADPVTPGSLAVLGDLPSKYKLPDDAPESQRRLALAKWIVSPDNPLTARVLANRLWHYHFGTGIVDTPSDFGFMGGRPTHPELLDFLARQLVAGGWRLKPVHRLIVLSQTYRQASAHRPDAAAVDGDARLLWRFPSRRLTGEEVRDTMLAIAGKLPADDQGGPGFKLYRYVQDNVATYHPLDVHGPETYRRSVYHTNARAARVDVLSDFDCPDPAAAVARRPATTTPLQALAMMNHRFTRDMADAMAGRLEKEAAGDRAAQVKRAFSLAY